MYESKVVHANHLYGEEKPNPQVNDRPKVIFENSSQAHITITAIDPKHGAAIEIMIRKDDLPDFVRSPKWPPDDHR